MEAYSCAIFVRDDKVGWTWWVDPLTRQKRCRLGYIFEPAVDPKKPNPPNPSTCQAIDIASYLASLHTFKCFVHQPNYTHQAITEWARSNTFHTIH